MNSDKRGIAGLGPILTYLIWAVLILGGFYYIIKGIIKVRNLFSIG